MRVFLSLSPRFSRDGSKGLCQRHCKSLSNKRRNFGLASGPQVIVSGPVLTNAHPRLGV